MTLSLGSTSLQDAPKFVAGVLACLSAMTMLELPHCNVRQLSPGHRARRRPLGGERLTRRSGEQVLSKCDLLPNRRLLDELLDADAAVPHLPTSPHISPHLPMSPHVSPCLPMT